VAAITGYWVVAIPVTRDPLANDFTLVFISARIGLEQGWNHIYSLPLQHQLFEQIRPGVFFNDGQRYLAPPPLAWITALLTPLGAATAFYVWLGISIAALVGAWLLAAPGQGLTRWIWLIAVFAWYPVLYALQYGQPAPLVLLAVVGCWRLAQADRPYLAGIVLALGTSIKPQLALAVPLALLASGRWRIVAGWAAVTAVLAGASLAILGSSGLNDYRSLLAEAQTLPNNRYFTLAYVVGPGALSYVAQAVVLLAAALAAWLNRQASIGRLIALGLVGGAFGASYWHLQDFTVLLGAAWLFWRDDPPLWQKAWLAVVALTIELAWPLRPIPLLVALAAWFVFLCLPSPAESKRSPATA
jgi:alpha-1,2-mannosyltransferase